MTLDTDNAITDYFLKHYASSLCTLCGNTGVIDTRATAVSAAGIHCGRLNWCICPNGQVMRTITDGEMPVVTLTSVNKIKVPQ